MINEPHLLPCNVDELATRDADSSQLPFLNRVCIASVNGAYVSNLTAQVCTGL